MTENIDRVIDELKAIVDQNGPDYLAREPYKAYQRLEKSENVSKKTAGLILYALINTVKVALSHRYSGSK